MFPIYYFFVNYSKKIVKLQLYFFNLFFPYQNSMEKELLTAELNDEHKLLQKEELSCEKIKDKIMHQAEKYHEQRAKVCFLVNLDI